MAPKMNEQRGRHPEVSSALLAANECWVPTARPAAEASRRASDQAEVWDTLPWAPEILGGARELLPVLRGSVLMLLLEVLLMLLLEVD